MLSVESGNMMKNTKTFYTINVSMSFHMRGCWELQYDVYVEWQPPDPTNYGHRAQ